MHYGKSYEGLTGRAIVAARLYKGLPQMATRAVKIFKEQPQGDAGSTLPACSICGGTMILAYDRYQQKVCVCTDCHTSLTIPGSAWHVASDKREARVERATADRRRGARRANEGGVKS